MKSNELFDIIINKDDFPYFRRNKSKILVGIILDNIKEIKYFKELIILFKEYYLNVNFTIAANNHTKINNYLLELDNIKTCNKLDFKDFYRYKSIIFNPGRIELDKFEKPCLLINNNHYDFQIEEFNHENDLINDILSNYIVNYFAKIEEYDDEWNVGNVIKLGYYIQEKIYDKSMICKLSSIVPNDDSIVKYLNDTFLKLNDHYYKIDDLEWIVLEKNKTKVKLITSKINLAFTYHDNNYDEYLNRVSNNLNCVFYDLVFNTYSILDYRDCLLKTFVDNSFSNRKNEIRKIFLPSQIDSYFSGISIPERTDVYYLSKKDQIINYITRDIVDDNCYYCDCDNNVTKGKVRCYGIRPVIVVDVSEVAKLNARL